MPMDPKLVADAMFHAERLASDPRSDHEVRFLARQALPALLAEVERLELELRAKDELLALARREVERLRGGEEAAPGSAPARRGFVPPTGPCPNCTLEWWEHDEQEQRECREALLASR
jgi:hypothetical protein